MQYIMNTNFIKRGTRIFTTPLGLDYTLRTDVAYKLSFDGWEGVCYLEETKLPVFPEGCYTKTIDKFINKVLVSFNSTTNSNTGVLLTGLKGSGKTLTAKRLAVRSGIPMIIVSDNCPACKLINFFSNIHQEVCVIFDEIDKNTKMWDTSQLLSFLDGFETLCKKLVIFTCNNVGFANENLIDRCSRIRYFKEYKGLSEEEIDFILDDLLLYDDKKDVCKKCISSIKTKSYDNVISFIKEVNNYKDEDPEELLKDLNINVKQ